MTRRPEAVQVFDRYAPGMAGPFLVIANSSAGSTDDDALAAATTVLREYGETEVLHTCDADELDDALDHRDGRRLVVAGGDGSLHAVVAVLHRRGELTDGPLALLPLGTGNDFARGLALPADPADAARIAADGTPRTLDLILDDAGGVVVNSVHAGTGAEAARAGAGWKERFGRLGYLVGAIKAIVRPPAVRVRVVVDGQEVCGDRDPILQVALGNGAYVGGGAPLTPGADPSDGLIQVLVSTATGPLARLVYAAGLLIGRHHHRADVHTVSGKVVEVSGQSFWCSTDGELTGPYTSRTWRIDGAAYSLMTGAPAGSPPAPPSGQR